MFNFFRHLKIKIDADFADYVSNADFYQFLSELGRRQSQATDNILVLIMKIH